MTNCRTRIAVAMTALAFAATSEAVASTQYELGGFAQASYGVRTWPTNSCTPAQVCRFMLGEERLQLKLQAHTEGEVDAAFTGITDLIHDDVLGESRLDPRELYVELSRGRLMVRVGRQVITWGTGDLFFVNDIFPKDWESFYLGRPFEYFKVASDGLRVLLAPLDAVVLPRFTADALPPGARFLGTADAQPNQPVSGGPPPFTFHNVEAALRIYGSSQSWDGNLYASKTFYRTPSVDADNSGALHMRYPPLVVVGASAVGPFLGGVANVEAGAYYSRSNLLATRTQLPFNTARALLGYARPLWEDGTLSAQVFTETILQYKSYRAALPAGQPAHKRVHPMGSLRFTQALFEQTLQLNLLAVYAASPSEGFVNATARYSFNDAVWAEVGMNFFGGNSSGNFGMFRRDSNAFLNTRYAF